MFELVLGFAAMLAAATVLIVSFVLPIISFMRTRETGHELERLRERVLALDEELRRVSRDLGRATQDWLSALPAAATPAQSGVEPVAPRAPAVAALPAPPAVPERAAAASAPPVPAAAATEAPRPGSADTLETQIGGRWLLYVGTVALVLGLSFFVKYAFDNNWITETGRVVLGAVAGLLLIGGGFLFVRRGYALYGQIVTGGGFAALHVSTYAALDFYGLIGREAAFGLMVLITAAAAAAADRQRSQGLAVFAVIGGFVTPFLVGGTEDSQIVLLTYDAILVAGTMYLAHRRAWPLLNLASYVFVLFTCSAWAGVHYAPSKYIRTEFFLTLFCAMFLFGAFQMKRLRTDAATLVFFVLMTAPFAYHAASLGNLLPQRMPLPVYLTLASLAGVLAGVRLDRPWLRLVVFGLTMPVVVLWIADRGEPGWYLAPFVVLVASYGMHLVALAERLLRVPDHWALADMALFHANGMALFGGTYLIVNAVAPGWTPMLAVALAAWNGILAWASREASADGAFNSLAMAFAMLGFAIGLQFDDWWAMVGWTIEAAAIVWVGLTRRRDWMRLGGAVLLAATLARLFALRFFDTPAALTVVFNARVGATLVMVAACYVLAALHRRLGQDVAHRGAPEISTLLVGGNVLTILLFSTEISFYWNLRASTDATADLARMVSLSVAWAIYGTALIIAGIMRRYAPIRYLAIALLLLTIGKVFLVDLNSLGGLYRIVGFVGLGLFLLLGAWLYQRYRDVILGKE